MNGARIGVRKFNEVVEQMTLVGAGGKGTSIKLGTWSVVGDVRRRGIGDRKGVKFAKFCGRRIMTWGVVRLDVGRREMWEEVDIECVELQVEGVVVGRRRGIRTCVL